MVGDDGDCALKRGMKSDFLAPVLERLDLGEKDLYLSGLWGSSRAYFLASLFKEQNCSFLIITPDLEEAQSLQCDLRFFLSDSKKDKVYLFPPWEVLPFEPMSPTPEITARRMEILFLQQERKTMLVVTPIQALMEPVLPPDILSTSSEIVETGEEIERDLLIDKLQSGGYRSVDMVENMGEFSVRGGILDFFGPLQADPIRIEFFGDQIDSIRTFDYSTQRTKTFLEEVILIPARAVILNEQTISSFSRHLNPVQEEGKELLEKVSEGILFPGIEQYLTYFYQQHLGLIDYMEEAWVFLDESYFVYEKAEHHQKVILEEFKRERNPLYPPPEAAYFSPEVIKKKLKKRQLFQIDSLKISKATRPYLPFHIAQNRVKSALAAKSKEGLFTALAGQLRFWLEKGYRLVLTANSRGQAERLKEILFDEGIVASIEEKWLMGEAGVSICIGNLDAGFMVTDEHLGIITEKDVFGKQKVPAQSKRYKSSRFLSTLSDLMIYDLVVHVDHGIGCYMGLTKIMVEERPVDFFIIEYEGGDRLLVPLDRLYLVQKYMGARGEQVRIDKLGGKSWARVKENVKASLKQMAEELLQL
jgi:transcription-repair coupling factor (superfamily II helicase)